MAAHLSAALERTNRTRYKAGRLVASTRSRRRPAEALVRRNLIEGPERAAPGIPTALTGRLMARAGTAPRITRRSLRDAGLVMPLLPVQDSA